MKKALFYISIVTLLGSCQKEAKEINIVVPKNAGQIEMLAALELQTYLSKIYPGFKISSGQTAEETGQTITIGTVQDLDIPQALKDSVPNHQEGYIVTSTGPHSLLITSEGELGVLYGVYHFLENLGCRFLLDTDYVPELEGLPDFSNWNLRNEPLISDRYANPWEVYLEGCSSWDLEKWELYITQVQKMGYNSILMHAYGNDPMFSFSFNGKEKPVGFLTSSIKGRGWGQKHVNDVRRIPGGEKIFQGKAFGSERAIVPDEERVTISQDFMGKVFSFAAQRGVRVNFALDFDILSNIPQDIVKTLPETDRFQVSFEGIEWMGEMGGTYWIPQPDSPEGYAYYKAQVQQVLNLYPDISTYTLWRRRQHSIYNEIQYSELPDSWKVEYKHFVQNFLGSENLPQAVSIFAQRKLALTYRQIFNELGREDMKLAIGSWHLYNDLKIFETLELFMPRDMKIIILDSEITRSEINLQNQEWIQKLSVIMQKKRYVPIIWAHHDDGEYIGSPFKDFENFYDLLTEVKADGFGVIHWINRPLDLFFLNHLRQVWSSTQNESAFQTCQFLANGIWHNDANMAGKIGDYLYDFWSDFPPMSRANSAYVFDSPISRYGDPDNILAKIDQRLDLLNGIETKSFDLRQKEFVSYYINYEIFLEMLIENQLMYEKIQDYMEQGAFIEAEKIAMECFPEKTMEQLALTAGESYITNGDMGLLFSLGVRWLPHFIDIKQQLGMEAILINFAPTSHEALAQMPGKETYFLDNKSNYWMVMGEEECGQSLIENTFTFNEYKEIFTQGVLLESPLNIELSSIEDQNKLPAGSYELQLMLSSASGEGEILVETADAAFRLSVDKSGIKSLKLVLSERSAPVISIIPMEGDPVLCGMKLEIK